MNKGISSKATSSKRYAVYAAMVAAALVATPMVIGAGNALATQDQTDVVAVKAVVTPVVIAPVAAPAETCQARKVRVVYSGYGSTPAACLQAAR